jgi:transposase
MTRFRRSGQTVRQFCAREGLAEPSFYHWRTELARRDRQHATKAAAVPDNLPRREVVHEVPPQERVCACGCEKQEIGRERSEQLDYEPASLHVVVHVRPKYACPKCESGVVVAEKPIQAIDKGLPGPGLLAHVATSKYAAGTIAQRWSSR